MSYLAEPTTCQETTVKVLGMCIDKKVVAGLAVTAALVWWLAPGAIGAALPLLLLAICPLSMLLMMKAMADMQHGQPPAAPPSAAATADDEQAPAEVPAVQARPASRWN